MNELEDESLDEEDEDEETMYMQGPVLLTEGYMLKKKSDRQLW